MRRNETEATGLAASTTARRPRNSAATRAATATVITAARETVTVIEAPGSPAGHAAPGRLPGRDERVVLDHPAPAHQDVLDVERGRATRVRLVGVREARGHGTVRPVRVEDHEVGIRAHRDAPLARVEPEEL